MRLLKDFLLGGRCGRAREETSGVWGRQNLDGQQAILRHPLLSHRTPIFGLQKQASSRERFSECREQSRDPLQCLHHENAHSSTSAMADVLNGHRESACECDTRTLSRMTSE